MSLMHGSIRLVTTPSRAATETSPALRARRWGVVWSRHVPDFRGWVAGQIEKYFSLFLWSTSFLARWTRWRRLHSRGKVLMKLVPAIYRASRNWRQHLDSTPWTGRGDKFHHTIHVAWCLDVNSLSTDVHPFRFDNAPVSRSAETSPNPTTLPKRSLNPRAFYFCTRTEQVSFYLLVNFRVQFTNKSVGSLWGGGE